MSTNLPFKERSNHENRHDELRFARVDDGGLDEFLTPAARHAGS